MVPSSVFIFFPLKRESDKEANIVHALLLSVPFSLFSID
ncbi:hypothetical protein BBD27_0433 [Streptococcus thermophilus]|nr:hypothetical protein BBD27_0433 [Streptococcus thermophilus]